MSLLADTRVLIALARGARRGGTHVHLSQEHLPYLRDRLCVEVCLERAGPVPYLPWVRAPYYIFVGRKLR